MNSPMWLCSLMAAVWVGILPARGATSETLRVYTTEPACFDVVFASVSRGGDAAPILAFNHRNGRTFFLHVGESLDGYRVVAHEPRTRVVEVPSTHSRREEKADQVSVQASNGPTLTLQLGQRLPQPGWMAHLVVLDSGEWCLVKAGDRVSMGGGTGTVVSVSEKEVALSTDGAEHVVTLITQDERQRLIALWEQRRAQAERECLARRQEAEEAPEAAALPLPRAEAPRALVPRPRVVTGFGTEFRYPTEFEVIPAIRDTSGRVIQSAIVVPKRFTTRSSGLYFESR